MITFIKRNISSFSNKNELKILLKFSSVLILVFIIFLSANYFLLKILSEKDIKNYLSNTFDYVSSDISYDNGKISTQKYLSDVSIASDIPLYIFTSDGFLIDRNNQVSGYLDISNYLYASSFINPQTMLSPINENWRVFSYPIIRDNQNFGIILTGFFDPQKLAVSDIDELLLSTARFLDEKVRIQNNHIDISDIKPNEVHPDISFEIIDTFNKSIMSIGGPPAYIDKSYIQKLLSNTGFSSYKDETSGEDYLFFTKPIVYGDNSIGVVSVGKNLNQLNQFLNNQLLLSFIFSFILIFFFLIFTFYIYRRDISTILNEKVDKLTSPPLITPVKIMFDKIESVITLNQSTNIKIPADTYQYDICKLFFKNPNKHFDTLDIVDVIGERDEHKNIKRLVYDAIESINSRFTKLTGRKLILHKDKTYFIDPDLALKII